MRQMVRNAHIFLCDGAQIPLRMCRQADTKREAERETVAYHVYPALPGTFRKTSRFPLVF